MGCITKGNLVFIDRSLLLSLDEPIVDKQIIKQAFLAYGSQIRIAVVLIATFAVIIIGQAGRELLPPDDLREAEVAREMYVGGDYIIPHLAGIPFIEKPSGFPFAVMTAYRIAGKPSETAARMTSVFFAFISLMFVFLLGNKILGMEGGAFSAAILGLSMRFCRTAHEILLDNALTAMIAAAVFFSWIALDAEDPKKKRMAYSAMGFALGLSFLFKGMVGPVIFVSGFLLYIILSRRFSEFRHIFSPLQVTAFLLPVLGWLIPFILNASPDVMHDFFINNQLHRFLSAYLSNERPFYFYLLNIWVDFIPGGIILPLSIFMAWRLRYDEKKQAGMFFLCLFIAPLFLLSFSKAKDLVYFLPVYPSMAMLVSCTVWKENLFGKGALRFVPSVMVSAASVWAAVMTGITYLWGGNPFIVAILTVIILLVSYCAVISLKKNSLDWAAAFFVVLCSLAWCLWFTGPVAKTEIEDKSISSQMNEALNITGNREMLLYIPNDGLRGYAGFYGNGTVKEIISPYDVVDLLRKNPDKTVVLSFSSDKSVIPRDFTDASKNRGYVFNIEAAVDFGKKYLLVMSLNP
jgi:4-amino-4-deoxy-L-arabinose transferase-like glycosyltransferase